MCIPEKWQTLASRIMCPYTHTHKVCPHLRVHGVMEPTHSRAPGLDPQLWDSPPGLSFSQFSVGKMGSWATPEGFSSKDPSGWRAGPPSTHLGLVIPPVTLSNPKAKLPLLWGSWRTETRGIEGQEWAPDCPTASRCAHCQPQSSVQAPLKSPPPLGSFPCLSRVQTVSPPGSDSSALTRGTWQVLWGGRGWGRKGQACRPLSGLRDTHLPSSQSLLETRAPWDAASSLSDFQGSREGGVFWDRLVLVEIPGHTGRWALPRAWSQVLSAVNHPDLLCPALPAFPSEKYGVIGPQSFGDLPRRKWEQGGTVGPLFPGVVRQRPCSHKAVWSRAQPSWGEVRPVQGGLDAVAWLRKPWVPCLQAKNQGPCTWAEQTWSFAGRRMLPDLCTLETEGRI